MEAEIPKSVAGTEAGRDDPSVFARENALGTCALYAGDAFGQISARRFGRVSTPSVEVRKHNDGFDYL